MANGVIRDWKEPKDIFQDVEAVILDNDGTLVDTMPIHLRAWRLSLGDHGIVFPTEQFYSMAGMQAGDIIKFLAREQNISPPPSVESIVRRKEQILMSALHATKAVKPCVDVLAEAKSRGLKVALASGSTRKDIIASLIAAKIVENGTHEGMFKVFDAVVTAEDVHQGKPDPETFLIAARRLGIEPARCVGLEDGDLGLLALQRAGMRAVDIRWHPEYPLEDDIKAMLRKKIFE